MSTSSDVQDSSTGGLLLMDCTDCRKVGITFTEQATQGHPFFRPHTPSTDPENPRSYSERITPQAGFENAA